MNEQEAEQMATEMWELARKSHWLPASPFSSLSPVGLLSDPRYNVLSGHVGWTPRGAGLVASAGGKHPEQPRRERSR